MRAFDFAAGEPWVIQQRNLRQILEIAQRAHEPDLKAIALKRADKAIGNVLEMRGSVAVLNVIGPLFRYANLFTDISGATSIEELAQAFGAAVEDPNVKAIAFNIDSPGGELAGVSELATAIYRARGKKPIAVYVDDLAASGAYWLASAADRIVVSDTARVGSIGVLATIVEEAETDGVKTYRFVSSVSPNKRPDLESEEGRDSVQELVDDLGRVFVETVARNRGVTTEKVIADFGKGFLRTARKAVAAGMADAIGTFEDVRDDLSGRGSQSRNSLGVAAAASPIPKKEVAMEEPIKHVPPALIPPLRDEGSGVEGADAETPAGNREPDSQPLGEVVKSEKPALSAVEGKGGFEAGRTEALAYAADVAELCALAGMGNKAAGFIRKGTAVVDVRKALLSERAAQDSVEIRSHTMPDTGTGAKPSLENNPVIKAVERLAAKGVN